MPTVRLEADESHVISLLDRDSLVGAVQRLVRIESWNGNETPAQEAVAELAAEAGLEVDLWEIDLDAVKSHPECSYEIERDRALGVIGKLGGTGSGRSLILNGHVDVVPPGDVGLWSYPPFEGVVDGGRIYGRGALDMKGPLVAGLFALRTIRAAGVELPGAAYLQSVIGEEDGGLGTLAAILRGPVADGAIVMEPTELAVAPAQAGCLNFRIRVRGLAAHGAVREEGISAFEKLIEVYRALQELESRRNRRAAGDPLFARYRLPFPISIGTLRGGDWASSVPDHVVVEGRFGVMPDEALEAARAELEDAVAQAAAGDEWLSTHPPVVEWWGGRFLPARIGRDHPLTRALAEASSAVAGEAPQMEGVPFGSDAGLLSRVGRMPAVLFGAGDIRRAHRPDEYVDIDQLTQMARVLAVTVMRFCK